MTNPKTMNDPTVLVENEVIKICTHKQVDHILASKMRLCRTCGELLFEIEPNETE